MTDIETKIKGSTYLARFVDGPLDGETLILPGPWPLPERLLEQEISVTGFYVKWRESQVPDDHPGLARGAEYIWTEAP